LLIAALWVTRRALRELRRSESIARLEGARLRVTLQSCGDALIATDVAGNIVLINPVAQALTGWREEQARGLPIEQVFRIVNEFTRESVENPVSRALREGKVVGLANHTLLIARDATERPIDDSGAPIKDGNGESIGVILVFRDVSGRKLAEQARERLLRAEAEREAAVEANHAKDEFLALVSHELRSPLSAMRGWVELLAAGLLHESEVPGALHRIHRNVRLQERLIGDLLDGSRIIAGKLEILRSPVDLMEIARTAVEECRSMAEQKGVSLRFESAPTRVLVMGDEQRLTQVVVNVIGNGIKFTPPGGSVQLRLDRHEGRALMTVADTGVGMTAEVIDRLFERFWQADSSRARREGGLGLGLAIVRYLVDEHEGTIRAESPGAGQGSTFVIELPLLDARPVAPAGPPEERPTHLSGIRILVVDDDLDSRDSLALYLRKRGAIVTGVSSTPEALQSYEVERPMVVVSDIGMPDEDGFALARALRERDAGGNTAPMIALSGFASAQDRRDAIEHGFAAHLAKPVDLDRLAALIERLAIQR